MPASVSIPESLLCAKLCQASYLPMADFHAAAAALLMPCIASADPGDEFFWALVESDCDLHLIFAGSHDLPQWRADFTFFQTPNPKGAGQVHAGACNAYWFRYPKIKFAVALAISASPAKPLIVTGHSLGGLAAILIADWLAVDAVPVDQVITFGAPRPGDKVFAAEFTPVLNRFVNAVDIVPHLPPLVVIQGLEARLYVEPGTLELLHYGSLATGGLMPAEIPTSPNDLHDQFADHLITAYIALLENLK